MWSACQGGLVMMVTAGASAKVTRQHGPKVSLMIGAVIVATGYVLSAVFMDAVWQLSVVSGVIGAGIGFAYGAMPALIMSAVPASETASANSFNTLVRSVGSSVSSAVAGAVLAASATTLGTVSVPSQRGFRTVLLAAAGAALIALVVAAFLPRRAAARTGTRGAAAATDSPATTTAAGEAGAGAQAVTVVPTPRLEKGGADRGTARSAVGLGVQGTVSAGGARPLSGAVITLTDSAGRQIARTSTDERGHYELMVPTGGTYLLITTASGLSPHASLVAVSEEPVHQDVRLAGRSALTGRVLAPHAQDGHDDPFKRSAALVAGALVALTDAAGRVVATSTTDAAGNYTFDALSAGDYVLTAQWAGRQPSACSVELADDTASTLDLLLNAGASLSGIVTAGATTAPLVAAVVSLTDAGGNLVQRTTTGTNGGYRFSDLPEGDYTLTASSYTPTTATVSIHGGRACTTDVHLDQAIATSLSTQT